MPTNLSPKASMAPSNKRMARWWVQFFLAVTFVLVLVFGVASLLGKTSVAMASGMLAVTCLVWTMAFLMVSGRGHLIKGYIIHTLRKLWLGLTNARARKRMLAHLVFYALPSFLRGLLLAPVILVGVVYEPIANRAIDKYWITEKNHLAVHQQRLARWGLL